MPLTIQSINLGNSSWACKLLGGGVGRQVSTGERMQRAPLGKSEIKGLGGGVTSLMLVSHLSNFYSLQNPDMIIVP